MRSEEAGFWRNHGKEQATQANGSKFQADKGKGTLGLEVVSPDPSYFRSRQGDHKLSAHQGQRMNSRPSEL